MRLCFFLEPLEPRLTLNAGFIATDGLPGGAATLDLGHEPNWTAFTMLPNGQIMASDYPYSDDWEYCSVGDDDYYIKTSLFRFNPDGSRDNRFGDNGAIDLCVPESFDRLLATPDGKILAMSDMAGIFRFTSDGRLDKTFHTVTPDFPIPHFQMYDFEHIAISPDGRIFSGGQSWDAYDYASYLGLHSFNSDGTPDRSFGDGGALAAKYSLPFGWGAQFVIQPDGKILVSTGDHDDDPGKKPGTLLRFNSDGAPDHSFAHQGQFRFGARETTRTLLLQPDGKIILVLSPRRLSNQRPRPDPPSPQSRWQP